MIRPRRRPQRRVIPGGGMDRMRFLYMKTKKRGFITTESYLRSEQVLGNTSNIKFEIPETAASRITERRLNIADTFTATEFSIFIYKLAAGQSPSAGILRSYPNPFIFTGAAPVEAETLENIYNGYLSVRVNSKVYVDSFDSSRFKRVGVAQEGLEVSTGATNPAYGRSQQMTGDYGFYKVTPTIQFSGSGKNLIELNLPEATDMADQGGGENVIVFYARGFLNQNRATFKSNV